MRKRDHPATIELALPMPGPLDVPRWFHLLPGSVQGVVEYIFKRGAVLDFGVLNGQRGRQQLVKDLIAEFKPRAIVETGTYRGTTTLWLAKFQVPVYTVEISNRFHAFSKLNLLRARNVRLSLGHSVPFLRWLYQHGMLGEGPVLFYLDAHWYGDLPVRDELQIIFGHPAPAIVLIDDFEVPDDPGYRFHDGGAGLKLGIDYLRTVPVSAPMHVFFPSRSSSEETGARRGCCIVTTAEGLAQRLGRMREARLWGVLRGTGLT